MCAPFHDRAPRGCVSRVVSATVVGAALVVQGAAAAGEWARDELRRLRAWRLWRRVTRG